MPDRSKITRHAGSTWPDIDKRDYKKNDHRFKGISRRTLIGESPSEQAPGFVTRYFEIAPGGFSTLERHAHAHSVVIVKGCGCVILDKRVEQVDFLDCVYIAPNSFHQFYANRDEILGFLCIVDRKRDRPELPSEEELATLRNVPEISELLDDTAE